MTAVITRNEGSENRAADGMGNDPVTVQITIN